MKNREIQWKIMNFYNSADSGSDSEKVCSILDSGVGSFIFGSFAL